ncbi:hypothetical protein D6_00229 [Faustovirus]|nr:hypothetical protein D6_00229 [Faustovirus]
MIPDRNFNFLVFAAFAIDSNEQGMAGAVNRFIRLEHRVYKVVL